MKKITKFISFQLLFALGCSNVVVAENPFSSNLPIVVISTDNLSPITNEQKIPGNMKIIFHPDGSRNYLTDQSSPEYLDYNGRIQIKIRGNTSQSLPKKPYLLTTVKKDNITNNNVSILGMPDENDWILNSLGYDQSRLRDRLSYDLARRIGDYATRCRYCEVFVNNEYCGLYMLTEKVKADKNRVNVVKITTADNIPPAITGGYILQQDKNQYTTSFVWPDWRMNPEWPDADDITSSQIAYLSNYIDMTNATSDNLSVTDGIPAMLDISSFCDFIIFIELSGNRDSYKGSTFYHKDRLGKLRAGPIWDFNNSYTKDYTGWVLDFRRGISFSFWQKFIDIPVLRCCLAKRWNELIRSGEPLCVDSINARIDKISAEISEAKARDIALWGNSLCNDQAACTGDTAELKKYIDQRIKWISSQLTTTDCVFPVLPKLVISKINYHPSTSDATIENKLEFLEITNNCDDVVDLSGIYFSELGLTYKFPNKSTLQPFQRIFLAGDSIMFKSHYGIEAFGQFSRDLSNSSETLRISDAFGNLIDEVTYSDKAPWPMEADGNGYFLELSDLNSDNKLASNWKASNIIANTHYPDYKVVIYPTIASNQIMIEGANLFTSYFSIIDITGKIIIPLTKLESSTLKISALADNVYFLRIVDANRDCTIYKFIKNTKSNPNK